MYGNTLIFLDGLLLMPKDEVETLGFKIYRILKEVKENAKVVVVKDGEIVFTKILKEGETTIDFRY